MQTLDGMRGELAYNSRIAAALLAVLAESGDLATRTRALRALGTQGAVVQSRGRWIGPTELAAMFRTAEVDARLARRVGQALMRPDAIGLALCYGGLATAEKAYRRCDHLLTRESARGHYEPRQIDLEKGRIHFHPAPAGSSERVGDELGRLLCVIRQGMLEAVPLLFGLVPATVRERRCAYKGATHCEFEVRWSRGPRTGLLVGGAAGAVLGAGVLAGSAALGWPLWAAAIAAPALAIVTAAAGRSIDLARQLEAVAGARRGHLALLDQLDGALAERMDTLAKVGAIPQTRTAEPEPPDDRGEGLVPVGRLDRVSAPVEGHDDAARPHPAATARTADGVAEASGKTPTEDDVVGAVGADGAPVDLREIVERVAGLVRSEWYDVVPIELSLGDAPVRVRGDADQIGFVVEQLLRNACEATADAATSGAPGQHAECAIVRVRLGETPAGVEVSVEDGGEGLDAEVLDRVFDPFGDAGPAGRDAGLGLPVCLRIVERHGGELRVQARDEQGTRVSFVLPSSDPV